MNILYMILFVLVMTIIMTIIDYAIFFLRYYFYRRNCEKVDKKNFSICDLGDIMKSDETIYIKYFDENIKKIEEFSNGDWIDLRATRTVEMKKGEFTLIPLGVGMILPKGYEAHIVPRSSTYKKWKIIQANHMGVIDHSYCGDNDQWMFPAIAMEDTTINYGDRICQFRIMKNQPKICFIEVDKLNDENRGGFGSTGSN